jgi:multiple sugar transport system permease protein
MVGINSSSQVKSKEKRRSNWLQRNFSTVLLYLIALLILFIQILPFIYLILQSLAPWNQVDRTLLPTGFTLRSYKWLLMGGETNVAQPWLQGFITSILLSTTATFLQVTIGAGVAYGISILRFRGSNSIKNFILFQMFYPGVILMVPTFLIIRYAGLYNTFWAMLFPTVVSLFAIFMFTNFFLSIPRDFIDSARIDGASDWRILISIVLPMARSIVTVVALFLFLERWTNLMWDLMVVKDPAKQTLNVLLATMFGPYGTYPGPLYAAGVLLTMPLVILFLIFSRNLVKGIQFVLK